MAKPPAAPHVILAPQPSSDPFAFVERGNRESDATGGSQSWRGFESQTDGSTPLGKAKGNRSALDLPPRRALTGPPPFGTLKGGR